MVFQPEEHLQDLLQRSSPPLSAVRVVSGSLTTTCSDQLPRQKRWILQLLHARRCLADLARLTQRSELNVAYHLPGFINRVTLSRQIRTYPNSSVARYIISAQAR